eukprot:PhF_6_TR31129/c0_g1_i1/m.45570/K14849/RRP1; ribosomal RNA-processing protein 1
MKYKVKAGGPMAPINHPRYEKAYTITVTAETPLNELCKNIANSDPETRKISIPHVDARLADPSLVLTTETAAIYWKGLFYFYFHADGQREQDLWAEHLAAYLTTIKDIPSRVCFSEQGFECHMREWHMLDKWRLDKYLYLLRMLVRYTLSSVPIENVANIFQRVISNPRCVSIALHLVDVLLDEIVASGIRAKAARYILKETIVWAYATLREPVLHKRMDLWILGPLGGGRLNKPNVKAALKVIPKGLLEDLTEAIGDPATHDSNRKILGHAAGMLDAYLSILESQGEDAACDAVTYQQQEDEDRDGGDEEGGSGSKVMKRTNEKIHTSGALRKHTKGSGGGGGKRRKK